ncbi:MAG TPA: DUF4193 family protein [Acidimicrobiales bacterium]|nr:DUF4193 family protein [Acidimicrobiales bacterium]
MADDIVEDDQPGEIDEEDLEGLAEEDLIDDEDIVDDDAVLDDEEAIPEEDEAAVAAAAAKKAAEEEEEDELEVDHDVEATLDEILKERLVVVEEEEDDEPTDREDQADTGKVAPKRPDEFVCQSCFLVKHPSQLADAKRQYCRDCV